MTSSGSSPVMFTGMMAICNSATHLYRGTQRFRQVMFTDTSRSPSQSTSEDLPAFGSLVSLIHPPAPPVKTIRRFVRLVLPAILRSALPHFYINNFPSTPGAFQLPYRNNSHIAPSTKINDRLLTPPLTPLPRATPDAIPSRISVQFEPDDRPLANAISLRLHSDDYLRPTHLKREREKQPHNIPYCQFGR